MYVRIVCFLCFGFNEMKRLYHSEGSQGIVKKIHNLLKPSLLYWGHLWLTYHAVTNPDCKIRPHRRCKGRDHPDGISQQRFRFTWGGGIFWKKPPVFDRSWRSPSKNTVKNSTERTCSWTRPPNLGQKKVKNSRVFQLFGFIFWVLQRVFFYSLMGGGPEAFFCDFGPAFGLTFGFFSSQKHCFFTVFLSFIEVWRLSSTMLKPS